MADVWQGLRDTSFGITMDVDATLLQLDVVLWSVVYRYAA